MDSMRESQAALEAAIAAAELKRSQGNLRGAYADYQVIAAERLGGDYSAADLTILQSLADLATLFGDFQAADDLLVSLVGLCQQGNNLHRADYGTLKRIHLALDRGQLRQANALFHNLEPQIGDIKAIAITPTGLVSWEERCHWPNTNSADRTVMFTLLYLEMGRLLIGLGQYQDALEMLNRGLTHATPGDSQTKPALARQQVPWLQLAIARACLESGLLPETEAVLTALERHLELPQKRVLKIQWHTLAGKLSLLRGTFGQATRNFQSILDLCHQLKSQRGVAIASLNLAQVLIILNQNRLAEDHLVGITADVEQLDDPHLESRLALLHCLARARSQSLVAGSTFSVSDLLQKDSLEASLPSKLDEEFTFVRSQSPNYLTLFEDRVLEFQWYLSQSNLVESVNMLAQIQLAFASTDSQLIHTKIKALQGILAYYQGVNHLHAGNTEQGQQQIRWAAVTLDDARLSLIRLGLKPEQWQVQRILGWCLMRLQSPSEDQEVLASDTNQLLADLTESLSPEQQVIFLLNKWTADEEYIATQIVRLRKLKKQLQQSPWYKHPGLRWQYWQLLNSLINHIDNYRGILTQKTIQGNLTKTPQKSPPTLWMRLFKHPWRRATLSFLVLPDQVFVVRNWFFSLDFAIAPLTRLELRNLIKQWYEHLESSHPSRGLSLKPDAEDAEDFGLSPVADSVAQTLAEKLDLSGLLKIPRRIRCLTIVPDDVLHVFPFAAFRHQEQYLIETFALNIGYDTSSLFQPESPSPVAATATLLIGVSQGGSQFAALPGVQQEIEAIFTGLTQQHLSPQIMLDTSVTKEALLANLASVSLLHIACHGIFQHNRADHSGLVLNPQSQPPEILSLREIASLNLTSLQHITLSACSSADHLVLPGRWVVSLPETLWRSGSQSILGNLWEVYDEFAIAFMRQFYSYLERLPRDEALRQTQLDCLSQQLSNNKGVNTSNPKYWAGFNIYGYAGLLKLAE